MKFIHLSDLHIGKRLHDYSLIDDQKYILTEILGIIREEKPNGVIIAGDVYDKPVPSAEAVSLFDDFLVGLSSLNTRVFVISGNHDSADRIAFGGKLMEASRVHMSPVYDGKVDPIPMEDDEYGTLNVYMLPFIKPANVRAAFPEETIESYTDAVRIAISHMDVDESKRNVIITHQFVTGAARSESEEVSVGGSDNVDASVFAPFDYTALGHIHRAQNCGSPFIRYSGTPLKYSVSEAGDAKSLTVVEFKQKGDVSVRTVPLTPKHDVGVIHGTYNELMSRSFYEGTTLTEDYIRIELTDEQDVPDAMAKMRLVYKNVLELRYDNTRTRNYSSVSGTENIEQDPIVLFRELFLIQNNHDMSEQQLELIKTMIEQIQEGIR